MKGILWIVIIIMVNNTCLQLFLSSSVISISQSRINKCAKSRSSFCLMISTNIRALSISSVLVKMVPFPNQDISTYHQLVLTDYKSPTAITLKPPKTAFVQVSCCKRASIKLSVRLPTIDISSIITTLRCLYFILNIFNSSVDRRFVPWYIFL